MNGDEQPRGSHFSSNRKPGPPKAHGYSPSSNYNYNSTQSQSQHGNHMSHGNHGNSTFNSASKPHHRKPGGGGSSGGGTFKRDNYGSSDKIIKQNDLIIKLLKEIRDRLPAPSEMTSVVDDADVSDEVEEVQGESAYSQDEMPDDAQSDDAECEVAEEIVPVVVRKPIVVDDDDLDSKVNGNY